MSGSRHLVDPELVPLLEALPAFSLSQESLQMLRDLRFEPPPISRAGAQVRMDRHKISGLNGAPDVPVILYRPGREPSKDAKGRVPGGILHIHGGGFVAGAADRQEPAHRELVAQLGCALLTVDYRLAPETPFPGAVEDCLAALAWFAAEAPSLGTDPARIGAMGESAGGGLAAALALLARDRGGPALAFQHLIYPMLDDRTCAAADPHPLAGEFLWNGASNAFGWGALLGAAPGSGEVSPYATPARATDLAGLPATFIATGALDLFVEENLEYARRLTRAGVPVELHLYPGAFHAFDLSPDAGVARRARRDSRDALVRALGAPAAEGPAQPA